MPLSSLDGKVKPRSNLPWIITNVALVVFCSAVLVTEWWQIQARESEGIRKENRFLTTEWYLLEQLKNETDAELARKNEEIERLRRLYQQLKGQNESPAELAKVEAKLKMAETERGAILAETAKAGYHPIPESTTTDALLIQRLRTLETQVEEQRHRAEAAETALAASRRQVQLPAPSSPPPPAEASLAPIDVPVLDTLQAQLDVWEPPPQATVAELKTRALVRALLNSGDVRRQYPELLSEFDGYLESYAAREFARGRKSGFTMALEQVRALEN